MIVSAYNALDQQTREYWYATIAAAAATPTGTAPTSISYAYDADGELLNAQETSSASRSAATRTRTTASASKSASTTTAAGSAGRDGRHAQRAGRRCSVRAYDADGNRTQLAATIGGTADFVNSYTYDSLNREVQVKQAASTAGDAMTWTASW